MAVPLAAAPSIVELDENASVGELDALRTLIREYFGELAIDLSFQNVDEELAKRNEFYPNGLHTSLTLCSVCSAG